MVDTTRFPPGTVLAGKYVVERVIASGGMGLVLAAMHRKLEQRVAIKVLHERYASHTPTLVRFEREGRLAASLRSEHVVRVHDVETTADGTPFLVMEYLEGEDLGAIVQRGPVPEHVAVGWILQACDALAEAHARGIIHRDLKPDNLFLARRGPLTILKLLDFGISKCTEPSRHTHANERFGTPVYMSPEQLVSSSDVDARSDVWALGVVLFELLTGRLPFDGEELSEIVTNTLTRAPHPVRRFAPDTRPELEALLLRCLTRERARRLQSVDELAVGLADFVDVAPTSVRIKRAALAMTLATPETGWAPMPVEPRPVTAGLPSGRSRLALRFIAGTVLGLVAVGPVYVVARSARETPATPSARVEPPPPATSAEVVIELPATPSPGAPSAELSSVPAPNSAAPIGARVTPARASARPPAVPRPTASDDYEGFGGRK